ncbi:ubiquinone biosynthesis hydrox [Gymnopus androsaceus JB14]|uniref:Ubiquinone biosynthesis monooxygenase COQ6, mitochondrial n=1 Tax=Gymnopus androsaceus JB14 TaxID=1447944 RepID=A0A6A4I6I4_9AGAR|nr:ubiquinone biosynthesis hydrox [Gymnopus androsaceus JB14]
MLAISTRPAASRLLSKAQRFISTNHGEYDAVIVGGGPAGLALASALGSKKELQNSLKIALVEAGDLSKVRDWSPQAGTFSNRVVSLTNASQAFLKDIGSWGHVEQERTAPIQEMQVWDGVSDARITFSASELGVPTPDQGMARLTETLNLQRGLLRHLQSIPDVHVLDKSKVQSITVDETPGSWPLVHLDTGRVLKARLLIGADGLNSPVRSFAKISTYGWSYDTQAIVCTMVHSPRGAFLGPNTTAYQRFLPTGPIAFLPISDTASSLVWSTKPALATALKGCEPSVLARMINAAFRLPEISMRYLHDRILEAHEAGKPITDEEIKAEILWREQSHSIDQTSAYSSITIDSNSGIPPLDAEMVPPVVSSIQPGTIASFPLRYNHAETYTGEGQGSRTVLVGDAAHTIHPLAGQGLNLGLGDVECLSRCIHGTVLRGGDIGSYTALLPYTQERYLENHKIMSACDKLHKLYHTSSGPLVQLRSVGLEVLNEFDSIKAAIMMSAGSVSKTSRVLSYNGDVRAAMFDMAAKGVENIGKAAGVAQVVRGGLVGIAVNALQNLAKAVTAAAASSQGSSQGK